MNKKLNGSVELLAKAMRQVFTEAVQEGLEPVRGDIEGLRKEVHDGLETTNKNVQANLRRIARTWRPTLGSPWASNNRGI